MDILKAMMIVGAGSCVGGMMRYLVSMWLKGVATNGRIFVISTIARISKDGMDLASDMKML